MVLNNNSRRVADAQTMDMAIFKAAMGDLIAMARLQGRFSNVGLTFVV